MSFTRLLLFYICTVMVFSALAIPLSGTAQTCTPVYKKTYGGNGNDEGLDIMRTKDSGSIVAGRTTSGTANTKGLLMKLNKQGALQWVNAYGGADYDELVKVKQTSDGGYVAVGNTRSSSQAMIAAFLLRTDPNGNILWSRRLGETDVPVRAKNVIQLSDGGFAVGLNLNDSTDKGDGLVLRTGADGSIVWTKRFDKGGSDGVHTLLEDGNALVISGYATGDHLDAVLMKLRLSDGAQTWAKHFVRGEGLNEECLNVEKIPGGYAFGVLSRLPESRFNSNDALLNLFKMNEDGTIYYQRKVDVWTGTGYSIESVGLRSTADSGFIYFVNDTVNSKNGSYKKFNASGVTEWGRGPSKYFEINSINGIDLFDKRGYLLTGTYKGFSFGNDAASSDVQVLKTDEFGSFGACTGDQFGAHYDTLQFAYIGPFTWNSISSESIISDPIPMAMAALQFTETLVCDAEDCEPVSTKNQDNCYASFIAHYSEKYKFVPFDVLKVNDGYILSGYIQHYWSAEPQIVKLRLDGTVAWAKTLNNYIHEASFQKLFLTGDGNILLTGPDHHVINHGAYTSTTFIKITPGGRVLWAKDVEGSLSDLKAMGNGIFTGIMLYNITTPPTSAAKFTIDAAGNISYFKRLNSNLEYVASYTRIAFDGNNMYAAGDLFGYTVIDKLDSSGKRIWTKQFKNGDNPMHVQSLHLMGDSVYVTATVITPVGWSSRGNLALIKVGRNGGGLKGIVLSKPDLVQDFYTYYFWPQTRISHITKTEDNNFVLANQIKDGADSVLTITKFSPTGVVLWSKKFPGIKQRKIMAVRDDEGSLLIAGYGTKNGGSYFETSTVPMLIRANSLGEITAAPNSNCSAVPGDAMFVPVKLEEGFPYGAPTPMFQNTDFYVVPFTPLERSYNVGSNLGCFVQGNCSSLKVSGPESVCNYAGTVIYKTLRNPGCVLPATWIYDTSLIRVIHSTDTTLSVQFRQAGMVRIIAKYSTGCGTLTDTLSVAVLPAASTVTLGPDTTICPGNTILLNTRQGFASYKWQNGSTDSSLAVTEPGLYHVTVTDLCGRNHADTLRVIAHPAIPFEVGPNRSKCNSDTLRFTAPSGFMNYSWSPNYNISSVTSQEVVVNPEVNTVYYVRGEKTPGCFAYDTIRVMVNRSPVIQLGSDQSFCYGDSATFEAGAGFSLYHWSTAESGSNISVKSAGQYWVKATTDKGCNSYDTVSIQNVWDLPQPRLDKQAGLCTGEARTLNPGRFASYRWQDGSVAPTYRASAPGQYFVRVTDLHGCAASDTAVVTTMLPLPGNFLPRDTALCSYSSLILKPLQTFNAYLWSTGDIAANITVVQAGTYWLEVEDQSGCRGKDSIIIKPKECTTGVYVSTAFTPNGDGKNDVFKALVFGQVNKFEFRIYNRWGQVVFYTTDPIKGWDGKVKGLDQDTGVFVWTCRYMLVGEQEKFEKGTVTIIR